MKITVVGTGYVGLVSGACFADAGNAVLCLDADPGKIAMLEDGIMPIHEPGLEQLARRNSAAGRLRFCSDYELAVEHGEVFILAVGTPPDEDGSADLRHVLAAARGIGARLRRPALIVNKSTAPIGTVDKIRETIAAELARRGAELAFDVACNPEFLREGTAIEDFMRPLRVVIGRERAEAGALLRRLYAPFCRDPERILEMDLRSAEMAKYAANAMLATRISFINELANLAERTGADIDAVRLAIGMDPRIGRRYLCPGAGYGGSCLSKDVKALIRSADEHACPLRLLDAVEAVNEAQKDVLYAKLVRFFGAGRALAGRTIALWGLAFKPLTDDMRDAPSRRLIAALLAAGAGVVAYDPVANAEAGRVLAAVHGEPACAGRLRFADSASAAVVGADVLVVVTEWEEFRRPDLGFLAEALAMKAVFDGRNMYDPAALEAAGLYYECIGYAPQLPTLRGA